MLDDSSNLDVLIDVDDERWLEWHTPDQWHNLLHKVIYQVLDELKIQAKLEVSVLLTNNAEIHALNLEYRDKDKPTNVLSFPNLSEEELRFLHKEQAYLIMLGELFLAFETLLEEAKEEKKTFLDHFNHLTVHGMLHLLGYDHESDDEEECMQEKEVKVLKSLNVNNPYQ